MEESFREFHQRTGATLVYVTHDQSEAMSLADHIAVMQKGELVQWATPETLYQTPRTEWIAGFIGQGSIVHLSGIKPGVNLSQHELIQLSQTVNPSQTTPVLIRPEHICLHLPHSIQGDSQCESRLHARVERCVFRGERHEIQMRLPTGESLTGYHPQGVAEGSAIQLSLLQGWSLESVA
ncbi:TOBE domain-containing protein [Nitrincola sp. A-D6]|uniref:TOBE domain-containing protein n=1 Tax=Nitrincola sp. A-D6 TaxID=1545442 RepID=UPI002E15ACE1